MSSFRQSVCFGFIMCFVEAIFHNQKNGANITMAKKKVVILVFLCRGNFEKKWGNFFLGKEGAFLRMAKNRVFLCRGKFGKKGGKFLNTL